MFQNNLYQNGKVYPEINNILELCKIFNCKLNDLVHNDMRDLSMSNNEVDMNLVKFNDKKQKEMKTLSEIILMIGKIGSIVLKVIIPFVLSIMLFVPYVVNNIEIEDSKITFNDNNIKLVSDDKIEINGIII